MARVSRREYLRAAGLLAVGGLSAVAGCTSRAAEGPGDPILAAEPEYGDWFDGVSNYAATVDRRGDSTVTVAVGSSANMGAFGFGPAAVAVSPGTTVVWEWTGKGGGHNVVAEDGTFDSGDLVTTAGYTFAHRFDEPGIYPYVCDPHAAVGMRGAVVVLDGAPGN